MLHVFVLILAIAGQPERIAAVLPNEIACNATGAAAQQQWATMFDRQPKDFSYRCVPAVVVKVTGT